MPQSTQEELSEKLKVLKDKVEVGATYQHYKSSDMLYTVLTVGLIEANEEPCVVYQAQYGEKLVWIRTAEDFLAEVEFEGQKRPRFTRIV